MKPPTIPNPPNAVFGRTSPEIEEKVLADQNWLIKNRMGPLLAERELREETAAEALFGTGASTNKER